MRVLLIEPCFDDNGAVRVSLDRAARWRQEGVRVDVLFVSNEGDGSRVEIPAPLDYTVASAKTRRMRWMTALALARGWPLARRADVVVSGREIGSGLLVSSLIARLAGRPLAITVHSNVDAALSHYGTPEAKDRMLAALARADLVVPVAEGLLPGLADLGIAAGRMKVVTNGVDVDRVRGMAAADPPVKLPPNPFIVAVGRLTRQKGFDLLVRAHAQALRQGAPLHNVLILGEGPDREALANLITECGVAGSVELVGFVPNPHAVVARSALFVLPSRWEGFPLSLAEAACLGVPSIACDCVSGPDEVLSGGLYGALVPVEDVDALARAMAEHLRESAPLLAAARRGRAVAAERFHARRSASEHLGLLEALVSRGAARQHPRPAASPRCPVGTLEECRSDRPTGG